MLSTVDGRTCSWLSCQQYSTASNLALLDHVEDNTGCLLVAAAQM
jgi:hypothetical protein